MSGSAKLPQGQTGGDGERGELRRRHEMLHVEEVERAGEVGRPNKAPPEIAFPNIAYFPIINLFY